MTVTINGTTGLATDSTSAVVEAVSLNHPSSSTAAITMDASNNVTLASNLTMTGGIYLGGTGSANLLEDYEEGTHQTSITMSTSGTVTLNTSFDTFSYTKVGRLVTITGNIRISSVSSPVGAMTLTLPFAAASGQVDECRSGGVMRYYDNDAGSGSYLKGICWNTSDGLTTLYLSNTQTHNNNVTPAASDELYLCISYITN